MWAYEKYAYSMEQMAHLVCEAVLQADGQWFDTQQEWKTFLMSMGRVLHP
jgi:hypothetical protein